MKTALIINKDRVYGQMLIDRASELDIPERIVKNMVYHNNDKGILLVILDEHGKYASSWCSANENESTNKAHIQSATSRFKSILAKHYFGGIVPKELFQL